MKNIKEIILVCGAEGGSITLMQNNEGFFYTTDEITLLEFTDDFTTGDLVNTSKVFNSVEKALINLTDKYYIFSLYPEKINLKYKFSIQNAYFETAKDNFISDKWLVELFQIDSFHKKFINLNIERIMKSSNDVLENFKEDNYTKSYQYFLDFTRNGKLDIEKFIVCTNMVYGWMPTILNLDLSNKKQIERVLNKLNKKEKLSLKDYEILKRSINNSVVGMSKFLHFVDPYEYPILDNKVYRFITGRKYATGIDKAIAYLAYINKMHEIINHNDYIHHLHSSICNKLGKKLSPMRSVELIMFYREEIQTHPNND